MRAGASATEKPVASRSLCAALLPLLGLAAACGDSAVATAKPGVFKAGISFLRFPELRQELDKARGKPTLINLWALW